MTASPDPHSFILNALLHDPRLPAAFKDGLREHGMEAIGFEPPRIPVSGANAADCEKAIEIIRTASQLYRSVVRDTIRNLNENLPVTATVDFDDPYFLLLDIEGDLIGRLANAAEQV